MTDLFAGERWSWADTRRNKNALFYIGPELSGVYFHQHSAAVNVLVSGEKHWFLFPPRVWAGPQVSSMAQWVEEILPHLRFKPLEVRQKAGEALFIPSGWSHATINVGEPDSHVVGVAIEIGVDQDLETPLYTDLAVQEEGMDEVVVEM